MVLPTTEKGREGAILKLSFRTTIFGGLYE